MSVILKKINPFGSSNHKSKKQKMKKSHTTNEITTTSNTITNEHDEEQLSGTALLHDAPQMRVKKPRTMTTSCSNNRLSGIVTSTSSQHEQQKSKRLSFNTDFLSSNKDSAITIATQQAFKLLVIGDSGVGKTSLLTRFCDHTFQTSYIDTVGVDCRIKQIQFKNDLNVNDLVSNLNSINKRYSELFIKANRRSNSILNNNDNVNCKLQIWDTAGAVKYFSIIKNYFRGVHGILLVYDVTNQKSFDNIKQWMKSITDYANDDVEIYLIANKCDLTPIDVTTAKRKITKQAGEELAKSYGLKYIETSAKSNMNIDNTFINITKLIKNKSDKKQLNAYLTLNYSNTNGRKTDSMIRGGSSSGARGLSQKAQFGKYFKIPSNNSFKSFNKNLNRKLIAIFGCFPIRK